MPDYLKMESDIIAATNGHFNLQTCNVQKKWYSVKGHKINEHNNLAQAMLCIPDYIIFDRFDNCTPHHNYTTLYYNRNMELVSHIDFNNWQLGNVYFDYNNNRNTFELTDPTGRSERVKLSKYFPDIMHGLDKYLSFKSFDEFRTN